LTSQPISGGEAHQHPDAAGVEGEGLVFRNVGSAGQASGGKLAELPDPIHSAFVMAVRVMEVGRASLLLRKRTEAVLTIAAAVGIKPALLDSIRVPYGEGLAGIVAEKGMGLLGRSANNDTFVIAPVITPQGVEGVLCLTDRLGGRPFTGRDLASATFMAAHIADLLEYRRLAMMDFVTGLPNRRAFEDALERELARSARNPRPFSVVFLDVDGLKAINDRHGHAAGDDLLRTVARGLQHATRQYDFAARIGGDEFGVLLADAKEGERSLSHRISRTGALRREYSLSTGTARYPDDGRTARQLLEAANKRMYADKRQGRSKRNDTQALPH
jgi:diguanylate cyclase (GGDEF)-like protein